MTAMKIAFKCLLFLIPTGRRTRKKDKFVLIKSAIRMSLFTFPLFLSDTTEPISENIPMWVRSPELSYSHHREVENIIQS